MFLKSHVFLCTTETTPPSTDAPNLPQKSLTLQSEEGISIHRHKIAVHPPKLVMSLTPLQITLIAATASTLVLLPALYFLITTIRNRRSYPPRIYCTCGGCACGRVSVPTLLRERLEREALEREIPKPPCTSITMQADDLVRQLMAGGNAVVGRLDDRDVGRADWELQDVVVTGDGVGYVGRAKGEV